MRIFNWGIIGPGKIARKFADDLRLLPNARLHAVASTSLDRAQEFAAHYGAQYAFDSHDAMADCPDLDVVYVATPHILHCGNTLSCLEKGIPVLCEKPFSMNMAQTQAMIDTARRHNVFLMEALWTFFIPGVAEALAMVQRGDIGAVHTVEADFGFITPFDAQSRLFAKELGGGTLLDIGIYPVLLALDLFGKPTPDNILAVATKAPTGVDDSCAATFHYPAEKRLARIYSTVRATTPVEAVLYGEHASIRLHSRWHHAQKLTLSTYGREQTHQTFDIPFTGWGYHFEAAHVMECLEKGLTESPRVPLQFTADLTETLDAMLKKIDLQYS